MFAAASYTIPGYDAWKTSTSELEDLEDDEEAFDANFQEGYWTEVPATPEGLYEAGFIDFEDMVAAGGDQWEVSERIFSGYRLPVAA